MEATLETAHCAVFFVGFMSKKQTLIYLAGFFDGEGHIGFSTSKRIAKDGTLVIYHGLRISVSQVSPSVIELFKDTFGTGHICKWLNQNQRVQFQWMTSGKSAYEVIKHLFPYLIVKKDEAELAIKYQELPWRDKRAGTKRIKTKEQILKDNEYINRIASLKRRQYLVN